MENQKLKVGDIVRLKSGSPKMTIGAFIKESLEPGSFHPKAVCHWIDSDNKSHTDEFHEDALELVENDVSNKF